MRRSSILGLFLLACSDRTPPAGAGSLETTPTGSAARPPEPVSAASALTTPNGGVLALEPGRCRVALLRDGAVRWEHLLSGCAGFLEANVAMDSTLYVRDPRTLTAFSPDGALEWAKKLGDTAPTQLIAMPAVLADSRAAIATTAQTVTVFERDGAPSWSFSLPTGEALVAPPVGMRTEGMVLVTSSAVYYLGATGEVRWRTETQARKNP